MGKMIGNLKHNLLLFTIHGRVTKAQSKNNICYEGTEMAILLFLWSFLTSSHIASFINCIPTGDKKLIIVTKFLLNLTKIFWK